MNVQALVGTGLGIGLFASTMLAALIWLLADLASRRIFYEPGLVEPLRLMSLAIVPLVLIAVTVGILNGIDRPVVAQFIGSSFWPSLAVAFALLVATVQGAATALLASMIIAAAAGLLVLGSIRTLAVPGLDRSAARPLLHFGWPLLAVDTVQVTLISAPTIILGMYRDSAEVGIFSLCNRLSLAFTIVMIVLAGIGSPKLAVAYARGEHDVLQAIARRLIAMATLVSAPACIVVLLFPTQILSLFGPDFAAGHFVLRLLVLGQVVGILFACSPNVLEMTGNGWRLRRLNIVALIACMAGCFLLIPSYGAVGASVATALTLALYYVAATIMVRRHVGIDASPIALWTGAKAIKHT